MIPVMSELFHRKNVRRAKKQFLKRHYDKRRQYGMSGAGDRLVLTACESVVGPHIASPHKG